MESFAFQAERSADKGESRFRVLVVDDDDAHRRLVSHILSPAEFCLTQAASVEEALLCLANGSFDAVLLDYSMPGATGLELCERMQQDARHTFLPVIMVTGRDSVENIAQCMRAGACDYLSKPYHAVELEARVRSAVQRKRATDRLDDAETILFTLAQLVESRDSVTGDHCERLAELAERFALALGLDSLQRVALRRAAVLHDLGKIAIPDVILLKRGPLDGAEWSVMKKHPVIGAELCSRLHTMRPTVEIVRHHHERWDGSGYPDGLSGDRIPFLARVFQLIDIYDALVNERPYKAAYGKGEALQLMRGEAASGKLDPLLASEFFAFISRDRAASPSNCSSLQDESIMRTLQAQGALRGTRFEHNHDRSHDPLVLPGQPQP